MKYLSALVATIPLLTGTAFAKTYGEISLSTEVSKRVANDEMTAILSKNAQAPDAKTLSKNLNATLNKAQELAKKYPNVKLTTGNQTSYPRYNNAGKIIGLNGSVSVNLQSQNFEEAGELLGELQTIMTMDSLSFGVSDTSAKAHQKSLMTEAIAHFKDDAKSASLAFGAKDYKLISVRLDAQNHDISPAPIMYEAVAQAKASDASGVNLSGGEGMMRYRIDGTIELVP